MPTEVIEVWSPNLMTQTEGSRVALEDSDCCGLSQDIRSKTLSFLEACQ